MPIAGSIASQASACNAISIAIIATNSNRLMTNGSGAARGADSGWIELSGIECYAIERFMLHCKTQVADQPSGSTSSIIPPYGRKVIEP